MSRRKLSHHTPIPEALAEASQEVRELGMSDHALNVQISEFDYLRAKELAFMWKVSVSEVVRRALSNMIDEFEKCQPGVLDEAALAKLQFEAEKLKRQEKYKNRSTN